MRRPSESRTLQNDAIPVQRDLVLLGGGHSHVAVLKSFAMRPQPGTRLTLITRDALTPYSGMLPGHLAGHYSLAESHIDLGPLCRFARARLYHASATGLDLERREVLCDGRPPVPFDILSIDIGAAPSATGIEGAARAVPVKPVHRFLEAWADIERRVARGGPFRIVVIGAGAGGVELSLSLQHRLKANGVGEGVSFAVVTRDDAPLVGHGDAVRRAMQDVLARRGIALHTGHQVTAVESESVVCADGTALPCDAAILVTNAAAPAWLRDTGLALDDSGFIRVGPDLQSPSHAHVFAAGDIAAIDGHALPKSGVYAVREGPVLADNLRRAGDGRPLKPYRPQPRILALISTGDRYAIASYGPLTVKGRWVWRLKDWIDRRWMRKYQDLPKMADDTPDGAHPAAMRCGGCGAKVASAVLRRVLDDLQPIRRDDVLIGLDAPDDAAVITVPPGQVLVQTVDHFRAFIDDPYLFGRVTANHCLGDIHAMAATPHSALALVTLPYGPEAKVEAALSQVLAGALETLNAAGVALIGGHTGEGAELMFGLSVNGLAARDRLLRKSGMKAGEALVLTKPLGTGAIFAADMRAEASSAWVDGAIQTMLLSNGPAAECLVAHGAGACTDVTGFGLLGHLIEMLRASGVGARLDLESLPALDGALDLLARDIQSSLHPANEAFAETLSGPRDRPAYPLLFDPQTAGGLLASLPADRAAACVAALRDRGYQAAAIVGAVRERDGPALVELS